MSTVLETLNNALLNAMQADERVYILGEDILDPYGGAFKVTRGLSSQFPERVLTTPISEAAIVGMANGMALRGLRPIAEVMFGDFVTLAADQLINHASKFRWMYNEQVDVPLVLRLPMGGRRGYGPTHSQSIEKLFLGVPGLKMIAPSTLGDPAALLREAINDLEPVLFVEHKLLYPKQVLTASDLPDWKISSGGGVYPTFTLQVPNVKPKVSIATYGYNFEIVRAAAQHLMYEHEIFCEIIVFSQLSPFELDPLIKSVGRTQRLITFEEGTYTLGWGAEIAALTAEKAGVSQIRRVAAKNLPIGNSKTLEDAILPDESSLIKTVLEMLV